MRTELCEHFGIEFPIFAFSHCRDVVAAVSQAGGFGVLGAVGFSPEQLAIELKWIDEHVDGKPYGVDVVMPMSYEGFEEEKLQKMISEEHRNFTAGLMKQFDIPELPEGEAPTQALLGWSTENAAPQIDVALAHPIKLLRRKGDGAQDAHAAGLADGGDDVAAVAEREDRELEPEHVTDAWFHNATLSPA